MNRKIRIIAILLILMACVVTACNNQKGHIHQYSSDWAYNNDQHWHSSTCDGADGCGGSVSELADHNMVDGACTVCGYSEIVVDDGDNGQGDTDGGENDGSNNGGEGNKPTVCEHQYSSEQSKAPTCTESGEILYSCTLCSDTYTESIDPIGHTVETVSSNNPSCTENGEIVYECTLCSYTYTESIDPIGHSEETVSGKAPTCTEYGMSGGKICSVCGEIIKAQIEIAPTGHSFSDGICSVCGESDPNYSEPNVNIIHTATTNNYCWVDKVSFTASESGEYSFILPAGLGAWDADDYASGNPGPVVDALHPNYTAGEFSFTALIPKGATYEFYIASALIQEWSISYTFVACEVVIEEETELDTVPLEIGYNSFGVESIVYSYTADSDGSLTLTVGSAISGDVSISYTINNGESKALDLESVSMLDLLKDDVVVITVEAEGYSSIKADWDGDSDIDDETSSLDISGEYIGTDAFGNQLLNVIIDSEAKTVIFSYYHPLTGPNVVKATYKIRNGAVTLYDESGKVLHPLSGTLVLVDNIPAMASFDGTQYTLSLDIPESDGGDVDIDEIEIKGEMIDCEENTFTVTAADISIDKMFVTFTPVYSGVYDFPSNHIFVENIVTEDGVPADKNEYDFFVLESYVTYIVEINLEYVAHVGDYTVTPAYQYPEGHPKNPIWYTLKETVIADYKGDYQPIWYQFYADVTGTLTITAKTEGATVMIAAVPDFDIAAEQKATLDVVEGRKYYIGIAATNSEEALKIVFSAAIISGKIITDGSINCPHSATLGENSVEAAASEGIYMIYKATSNGTLTLSANTSGFTWCFTDFVEPVHTVDTDISTHLYNGDLVYIYIETGEDIADFIAFTASFKDDAKKKWIAGPFIVDGSGANLIEIDDSSYALLQITGTIGQFRVSWDNPDATVLVDNKPLKNGEIIYITNAWFGPYFRIYLTDYAEGAVNLTITPM